MYDLLVNLIASVLAGSAVWTAQFLVRYRQRSLMRLFLGLAEGSDCLLVTAHHASSTRPNSVHRQDVAALVELATLAKQCGARSRVIGAAEAPREIGRITEFCVGGPDANPRTLSHLRSALAGVHFDQFATSPDELTLWVGQRPFRRQAGHREYALMAKTRSLAKARPLFVIAGQTARTNLAAAQFLSSRHREFRRTYGTAGRFAVVLEILHPDSYGPDFVRILADVTDEAFRANHAPPEIESGPRRVGDHQVKGRRLTA